MSSFSTLTPASKSMNSTTRAPRIRPVQRAALEIDCDSVIVGFVTHSPPLACRALHYRRRGSVRPLADGNDPDVDGFDTFELWIQHERGVGHTSAPHRWIHMWRVNHHVS